MILLHLHAEVQDPAEQGLKSEHSLFPRIDLIRSHYLMNCQPEQLFLEAPLERDIARRHLEQCVSIISPRELKS
jgi:hypothetical protein